MKAFFRILSTACIAISTSVADAQPLPDAEHFSCIAKATWRTYGFTPDMSVITSRPVLFLAEEDHGHGESLEIQCGIMRSIIDTARKITISDEISSLDCNEIMRVLLSGHPDAIEKSKEFSRSMRFQYWQTNGFWEYLASKIQDGTVILMGHDIAAPSGNIAIEMFHKANKLPEVQLFAKQHKQLYDGAKWFFEYMNGIGTGTHMTEDAYQELSEYLKVVIDATKNDSVEQKQWLLLKPLFDWLYRGAKILARNKYVNQPENQLQNSLFHAYRDSMMAELFVENVKKSTGMVIGLSATYHAATNTSLIEGLEKCCKDPRVKTMLENVESRLRESIYSIAFLTASGEYGATFQRPRRIRKPAKSTLERKLGEMSCDQMFIDLSSAPFKGASFSTHVYDHAHKSVWSENFSGFYFIKVMTPH